MERKCKHKNIAPYEYIMDGGILRLMVVVCSDCGEKMNFTDNTINPPISIPLGKQELKGWTENEASGGRHWTRSFPYHNKKGYKEFGLFLDYSRNLRIKERKEGSSWLADVDVKKDETLKQAYTRLMKKVSI